MINSISSLSRRHVPQGIGASMLPTLAAAGGGTGVVAQYLQGSLA